MAGLTWLLLLQTGAIIYLIYKVHRLEQTIGGGNRPTRRSNPGDGERKVIPLLRENLAPGPFKGKNPPPSDPKA